LCRLTFGLQQTTVAKKSSLPTVAEPASGGSLQVSKAKAGRRDQPKQDEQQKD